MKMKAEAMSKLISISWYFDYDTLSYNLFLASRKFNSKNREKHIAIPPSLCDFTNPNYFFKSFKNFVIAIQYSSPPC